MHQPSLPKWSVTIAPPKPDELILQLEAQAAPILTPREEHRIPTKSTSYFLSAALDLDSKVRRRAMTAHR